MNFSPENIKPLDWHLNILGNRCYAYSLCEKYHFVIYIQDNGRFDLYDESEEDCYDSSCYKYTTLEEAKQKAQKLYVKSLQENYEKFKLNFYDATSKSNNPQMD
jgi:hypothetical protein